MQTENYNQVEYDVIEHGPIRYISTFHIYISTYLHTDTGQGVTRPPWRRAAWPRPRPPPPACGGSCGARPSSRASGPSRSSATTRGPGGWRGQPFNVYNIRCSCRYAAQPSAEEPDYASSFSSPGVSLDSVCPPGLSVDSPRISFSPLHIKDSIEVVCTIFLGAYWRLLLVSCLVK